MSLANPVAAGEIVATTLRNRTGKAADNVTKNNKLLNRLRKKRGNVKVVSGGRTIMQEIEYAENGTFKRYSGYEALNISPSDVFTFAEYNYAQAAVAISMSGLEMIQNSGEEAIINLLSGRIKNAERTPRPTTSPSTSTRTAPLTAAGRLAASRPLVAGHEHQHGGRDFGLAPTRSGRTSRSPA